MQAEEKKPKTAKQIRLIAAFEIRWIDCLLPVFIVIVNLVLWCFRLRISDFVRIVCVDGIHITIEIFARWTFFNVTLSWEDTRFRETEAKGINSKTSYISIFWSKFVGDIERARFQLNFWMLFCTLDQMGLNTAHQNDMAFVIRTNDRIFITR